MKASLIHICLTKKLIDECELNSDILDRSKILKNIYLVRIPTKYETKILDELIELGFVEIIDKQNIKINKKEFEKYTGYF